MKKIVQKPIFIIFCSLLWVSPLFAADSSSGQQPGPQAERFKKDLQREKSELERKKPKPAPIKIPEEKPKPLVEKVSFLLKEIKLTGVSVFRPEDLRSTYQSYLNKVVTFKDIEEIIKNIKAKYREKGYLTVDAYLPEQQIMEGKIEIRVVEGKMGNLIIEGNRWFSKSFIAKYLHAKKNELLHTLQLQKDILRLNKISDLEVKAVLSAGEKPETSDIVLKVKDSFPWHTGMVFDNRGSRLTGKYRSTLYLRASNLSGLGDSLFLNSVYNPYSFGESVSYSLPIGTYGTKLGLEATYFKMKLGKEYKASHVRGVTQIYTPHITRELTLQENLEAYVDLGIDIKSIKKKTLGVITSHDQLRLPYFGFDITRTDVYGSTTFSPRFNFGIEDFLGASHRNHPTASRDGSGGFFFKQEYTLRRLQVMPWQSYLTVGSQFQAATHTLASSEQLQLGGAYSIRGYPEGDYLADMGGCLNLDWVFPMYLFPKDWKLAYSDQPLQQVVKPVFFMDVGAGKLKKVNASEDHHKFLAGIGGGLRFNFFNKISIRFECAKHIGDQPAAGGGPATFSLSFQSEL